MNGIQMLSIVEQYCRQNTSTFEEITVTRIPAHKTIFVEQAGENGRAVMLSEYKVDEKTCWAGYSSRSQTVYISMED